MEQEYVLLESFPTPHDAHLVANLLRTVDIPAKILDESIVSVLPILEMALGGVKVMVPRNHLEEARQLWLDDRNSLAQGSGTETQQGQPGEETSDDHADDMRLAAKEDTITRAFYASVIGLFFCPLPAHLYSAWVLLRADREGTSRRTRIKMAVAWCINLAVFAVAVAMLLRAVAS
ncbi:MAG: hypothetical protein BWY17_04773 [Deltaproteobacteria bacterium ADurb.Bin207]|nr:MAG: hypothetical protein BWY17_04773 [Deltaproteobacteria bacterium ADurb.Bin207]